MTFLLMITSFQNQAQAQAQNSFLLQQDDFKYWCQDQIEILELAREEALISFKQLNYKEALNFLVSGLTQTAVELDPSFGNALTVKAIRRGLHLYKGLIEATQSTKGQIKTLLHFLFKYYDFINDVAHRLDLPYYLPTHRSDFSYMNHQDMEEEFINFSKEQVRMVLHNMAKQAGRNGGRTVYPLGEPKGFLKALEMTTSYLSKDLKESINSRRFSCGIRSLDRLSSRIRKFNQTGRGYKNVFYAVNRSYNDAFEALEDCGNSSNLSTENSHKILSNENIYLTKNNAHAVLEFDRNVEIKLLTISAEAMNVKGGEFDLFINGEFKRNFIVPRVDPLYLTSINESADSIELRWTRGKVRIIKVEATLNNNNRSR